MFKQKNNNMTTEQLIQLKLNSFVFKTIGNRSIKYHVAEYIGHTLTEPQRQIIPIFKLLPIDKTEPIKYLHELNCKKYEIIEKKG